MSPVPVFADVTRSQDSNSAFLVTILNWQNLINVLAKTLFTVGMIAGISAGKNRVPLPRFLNRSVLSFGFDLLFLVACLTPT